MALRVSTAPGGGRVGGEHGGADQCLNTGEGIDSVDIDAMNAQRESGELEAGKPWWLGEPRVEVEIVAFDVRGGGGFQFSIDIEADS